ncbi:flagellar FlbD family protein [Ligilactobacillus agilis]|uniref:flagellar FlbD family protein n=1 Tax=Ligilactobacillus agilis TaxID=1601 RepID=UPI00191FE244|nr:flagellar FlbD family protein [Ligilactobacillus agilis]MBL1055369.1 flagellar FlbD family protein [Ligilactobacillus agilis]MBM6772123.1 flagellar FlbD family protein [Ligilactobacillus agilis]MDK6809385.1 flagellar FlbD family protein [Ligilactobacillus agilis]
MIRLTSFKGKTFYLNPDLLYRIDETPDTVLTLTDGKNLVVKETASEVVALIIAYRQKIYRQPVTNLVKKVGD